LLLRKDEEMRSKELGDGEFRSKKSRSKEEGVRKSEYPTQLLTSLLLDY
jgi:hypothetical protein